MRLISDNIDELKSIIIKLDNCDDLVDLKFRKSSKKYRLSPIEAYLLQEASIETDRFKDALVIDTNSSGILNAGIISEDNELYLVGRLTLDPDSTPIKISLKECMINDLYIQSYNESDSDIIEKLLCMKYYDNSLLCDIYPFEEIKFSYKYSEDGYIYDVINKVINKILDDLNISRDKTYFTGSGYDVDTGLHFIKCRFNEKIDRTLSSMIKSSASNFISTTVVRYESN